MISATKLFLLRNMRKHFQLCIFDKERRDGKNRHLLWLTSDILLLLATRLYQEKTVPLQSKLH